MVTPLPHIVTEDDTREIWRKCAHYGETAVLCAQCGQGTVFLEDMRVYAGTIHPLSDVIPRCMFCLARHPIMEQEKIVYVPTVHGMVAYNLPHIDKNAHAHKIHLIHSEKLKRREIS